MEKAVDLSKVFHIDENAIYFDDNHVLSHQHVNDCCESHYLSFADLTVEDFKDLEFDLSGEFFRRIEGYGIELIPVKGWSVKIPGYGYNNGYYTSNLSLVLKKPDGTKQEFDVTECQNITWE